MANSNLLNKFKALNVFLSKNLVFQRDFFIIVELFFVERTYYNNNCQYKLQKWEKLRSEKLKTKMYPLKNIQIQMGFERAHGDCIGIAG